MLINISVQAQEYCYQERISWRIDGNKILTGALAFISGSAKGFNETLQFRYAQFQKAFPGAGRQWFDPRVSWRNKYRDGDPDHGSKYFLSTSLLVMFTDQYHLNNFIQRACLTGALVIKLGDEKKPLIHYLFDLFYYSACYQAGFIATYYPFSGRIY